MKLEFRYLEGNDAYGRAALMADFGKVERVFRAASLHSALKSIGRRGWKFLLAMPPEGDSWRVMVRRPLSSNGRRNRVVL
jgi:hypothetical protein